MYSQEVKDENINNDEAKKIFKVLKNMKVGKIDYSKLIYKSGDNQHFDFNKFGPLSSIYLRLINGNTDINVANLNLKEFREEIDKLKKRKQRKSHTKK